METEVISMQDDVIGCNALYVIEIINRDLKIDDAANLDGAVLKCMNKKSFLKCGNCNKRLI